MDNPFNTRVFQNATAAADKLTSMLPDHLHRPSTGIICGSGLGGLAAMVEKSTQFEIDYVDIPHFSQSTVAGHVGKLLFGQLGPSRVPVVIMVGRLHYYEGHSIYDVTFPVRVLKLLGVNTLIGNVGAAEHWVPVDRDEVTNAAGGLSPQYSVGDLVVLSDHINLTGLSGIHPLRGPNIEQFGVRFPPLSDAYDLELRRSLHKAWKQIQTQGRELHEGVYAFVSGPSYETRAECRLLHSLGADLVGMSTVPEVIVARHCGMKVLALSLVTNQAVLNPGPSGNDAAVQGLSSQDLQQVYQTGKADHQEVLEAGRLAAEDLQVCLSPRYGSKNHVLTEMKKLVYQFIRGMP